MNIINKILRVVFFPIYWMKDVRTELSLLRQAHMYLLYMKYDRHTFPFQRDVFLCNKTPDKKDTASSFEYYGYLQ